jgi:hypothetical protein
MDLLGVEKVGRAMATYTADIDWKLADGDDFLKGRDSRGHTLTLTVGPSFQRQRRRRRQVGRERSR